VREKGSPGAVIGSNTQAVARHCGYGGSNIMGEREPCYDGVSVIYTG